MNHCAYQMKVSKSSMNAGLDIDLIKAEHDNIEAKLHNLISFMGSDEYLELNNEMRSLCYQKKYFIHEYLDALVKQLCLLGHKFDD